MRHFEQLSEVFCILLYFCPSLKLGPLLSRKRVCPPPRYQRGGYPLAYV
jgi:hypothetical protein